MTGLNCIRGHKNGIFEDCRCTMSDVVHMLRVSPFLGLTSNDPHTSRTSEADNRSKAQRLFFRDTPKMEEDGHDEVAVGVRRPTSAGRRQGEYKSRNETHTKPADLAEWFKAVGK